VLPRWRPQYGWSWCGSTADYFDCAALSQLVKCVTLDEFAAKRAGAADGSGVALYRLVLEYNPTWSDKGFSLYPKLRTLLDDLEYFGQVDAAGKLGLGCGRAPNAGASNEGAANEGASGAGEGAPPPPPLAVELQETLNLTRPLRGEREVRTVRLANKGRG